MNPVLVWAAAAGATVFHIWASHRKPWYLGAIVPALWMGLAAVLGASGQLDLGENWKTVGFTLGILLLLWLDGYRASQRKG